MKEYFEKVFEEDKYFQLSQQFCDFLTLDQMDQLASLH